MYDTYAHIHTYIHIPNVSNVKISDQRPAMSIPNEALQRVCNPFLVQLELVLST